MEVAEPGVSEAGPGYTTAGLGPGHSAADAIPPWWPSAWSPRDVTQPPPQCPQKKRATGFRAGGREAAPPGTGPPPAGTGPRCPAARPSPCGRGHRLPPPPVPLGPEAGTTASLALPAATPTREPIPVPVPAPPVRLAWMDRLSRRSLQTTSDIHNEYEYHN